MAHYLMHTDMGRANIFSADEVIAEAAKVLLDIDSSEYKIDDLILQFVNSMNSAYSTGSLHSTKEPQESEILRIVGVAYALCFHHKASCA